MCGIIQNLPQNLSCFEKLLKDELNKKGNCLNIMPSNIKNNKEYALLSIANAPKNFQYLTYKMRSDIDVTLEAVQLHGLNLEYTSKELQDNEKVVQTAMKENYFAVYSASDRLQKKYLKPEKKYTKEDLKIDIQLSLEELREKYPVDWFRKRFPNFDMCEVETSSDCYPENFIDEFTDQQVLSLFFLDYNVFKNSYEIQYRTFRTVKKILCDIQAKEKGSKWYNLKDIIYRKDVLKTLHWLAKDMYMCIPQELPYFKEMLFEKADEYPEYFRKDLIQKFPQEIQNEYWKHREDL